MKTTITTISVFVLLTTCAVLAESPHNQRSVTAGVSIFDDRSWIDANQILMFVANQGNYGYDPTAFLGKNDGLYFPFSSVNDILSGTNTTTTIFAAGIWIGAQDGATGDTLVTVAEYSAEYWPGPMVGGTFVSDADIQPEYRVYKLHRDSLGSNPNLDYIQWPVGQGAPVDFSGNPIMLGDQMTWTVFNDANPSRHTNNAGATSPMGLEIAQTTFAYSDSGGLGNIVFLKYVIRNSGSRQLRNMFVSLWSDPDIGGASDDLTGCDTISQLGFSYNATNSDSDYGSNPPAVGWDIFQGPMLNTGNPADTARMWGQTFPGFRNLGMTSFNRYVNGTDPQNNVWTYQYMNGLDAANGGAPLPNGTKYAHPGDPVTGLGDIDTTPADVRAMLSTGPFDLLPGDSTEIIAAVLVGQGGNRLASITAMHSVDIVAQAVYDSFFVVTSQAQINLSESTLEFGSVSLGSTANRTLVVHNTGLSPLTVSNIWVDNSVFSVSVASLAPIPFGGSASVTIGYTPISLGGDTGTLTVESNDPVRPTVTVSLSGTGKNLSHQYESASPLNVSPHARAGYAGGDRWYTASPNASGGDLLSGGIFLEPSFWGATTLDPDSYDTVEIRWRPIASYTELNGDGVYTPGEPYIVDDASQTQSAFMYSAFSGNSYLGFFPVPFTVWDVSDPANPRQLNVVIRDRDQDNAWNLSGRCQLPDCDPTNLPNGGDHRFNYTWILGTDYDPSGTLYGDGTGGTLDFYGGDGGAAVRDAMWVLWLGERGITRGQLAEESITILSPGLSIPPDILVTPDSLVEDLISGNSSAQTVTIANMGPGELTYDIQFQDTTAAATVLQARRVPQRTVSSEDFLSAYEQYAAMDDESKKLTAVLPAIGTDEFGDLASLSASLPDSLVLFFDDMESGSNGWVHYATNVSDQWSQTTSRSSSGSTSWQVSQHPGSGSDALQSPSIDLGSLESATLTFQHWYNFDDCNDSTFDPDGGIVEVTTDNGLSWTQIFPVGGYPFVLDDICSNPLAFFEAYSHDGGFGSTFIPAVFDLTPFAGSVISIRFHAGWDCGNCSSNEGWYIDDVTVYSTSFISWLSANPLSGTIAPGASASVEVTFDATGLVGGQHLADMIINSNDPDDPRHTVPVVLNVTGAPRLSVSTSNLNFPLIFIGQSVTDTLSITNTGSDSLFVSSISSDNSDFILGFSALGLAPGVTRTLPVTFQPTASGVRTGSLSLVSNDPVNPTVTVGLQGEGLIPPDIAISPDSLDADLFTGTTEDQLLTIQNQGGSDLFWQLEIGQPNIFARRFYTLTLPSATTGSGWSGGPDGEFDDSLLAMARSTSIQAELNDLTGVNILFDLSHGSSSSSWGLIFTDLQSRGASIAFNSSTITATKLQDVDILWLTDQSIPWTTGEINALHNWLTNGGGLLFEGDNTSTVPIFNSLLSDLGSGIVYSTPDGASGVTANIIPHETTAGVDSILLSGNVAHLSNVSAPASLLISDILGLPNTAYSEVGNGRIIAMADEVFFDGHLLVADNQLFANQVFDWLAVTTNFVSAVPDSGTVTTGGSTDVTVTFDATGLNGGDYLAELTISSNDPDQPFLSVPLSMHVTGAPDIAISDSSFDYGSLFVGLSATNTLVVSNNGTDLLVVGNISTNNTDYVVDVASFSLNPGEDTTILITFSPTTPGAITGILTIESNDPDEPTVTVGLQGEGLIPPVIGVAPDSLDEHLFSGDMSTQLLTIANTGGSDLVFSVSEAAIVAPAPPINILHPDVSLAGSKRELIESDIRRAVTISGFMKQNLSDVPWKDFEVTPELALEKLDAYNAGNLQDSRLAEGSVIIVDPAGDPTVDIIALSGEIRSDSVWFELLFSTLVNAFDFGGILSLDIDQNVLTGFPPSFGLPTQDVGVEFEVDFFSIELGVVNLFDSSNFVGQFPVTLGTHTLSFTIPLSALNNDDGSMNVSGVVGNNFGPTDWFPDVGHGTLEGVGWLSADPREGIIPAGGSLAITVTFDAGDLIGGDYNAALLIESNDPLQSEINIPVHLGVTGVPDIDTRPDSLVFGGQFIGAVSQMTFTVANIGTDILTISDIVSGNSHFSVNTTGFSLVPGDSQLVEVTFAPTVDGDLSTQLTISSDDPDEAVLGLPLLGRGLIPPEIAASPLTFQADLLLTVNPVEEETLTISNIGGSDLLWEIAIRAVSSRDSNTYLLNLPDRSGSAFDEEDSTYPGLWPPARSTALQAVLSDLTGVTILFDRRHGQSSSSYTTIINDLQSRGATVAFNNAFFADSILQGVDILWVREHSPAFQFSEVIAVRDWVRAGGALLLEGDEVVSSFNVLLDSLHAGVRYVGINPPNGNTKNIQPHVTTENIDSLFSSPVGHLVVDPSLQVLVSDVSDQFPLIAPVQIDNGVVYAMADEFFINGAIANLAANQFFANQVFDWLASGVDWLSVTPSSGVVAAGDSAKLAVSMDGSELSNGDYSANIVVTSNDPMNIEFPVLVNIRVLDFICGDVNADGILDREDLTYLWRFYFLGGAAPVPIESADLNCNGGVDLADLVRLADHFSFGHVLSCCNGSPPPEEQTRSMAE